MNKDWIRSTNVYEVNVRQYTEEGTFNAFAKHLPRLKDMGVQTLWFMPVTPIAQKNKKGGLGSYYACSDYTAINPEFGTINDFKRLVQQAQAQDFKVIIDWVANHTGWDHIWTRQHPEWYEKDEATGDFKRASGMDDIIELDFTNTEMRKAMISSMEFWIKECNIDGFRCDLAFWVEFDFWKEAIPQLNAIKPLFWLAESDPLEHPEYMQVFDAAYTWTWMHKTEEFSKKALSFDSLMHILEQYQNKPGIKAWFTSNHDENTWNGTEYEKYGDLALPLAVFSCTWQGVPLLYSGQELPNLKRLEFFDKDVIQWTSDYKLHDFYKILLELHSRNAALRSDAEIGRINTAGNNILAYQRKSEEKEIVVLLNFSGSESSVSFEDKIEGRFKDIFTSIEIDFSVDKRITVKPWSYFVFER